MRENLILNYISVSATTIVTLPRKFSAKPFVREPDTEPRLCQCNYHSYAAAEGFWQSFYQGALTPQGPNDAKTQRCNDATMQRCNDATMQRRSDATTQRSNHATTQPRNDATTQRRNDATTRRCNAATPQRRDDATPQRRNDTTYTCEMSVTSVVTELHPKGLLRVVQISIYAYVEICHRTQRPQKRPGPIKIHQKSG